MNRKNLYIFLVIAVSVVLSACEKNTGEADHIELSDMRLYPVEEIVFVCDAVAGNGNVLIVYATKVVYGNTDTEVPDAFEYTLKLIQNDGTELWTRNLNGANGMIDMYPGESIYQVMFTNSGDFSIFSKWVDPSNYGVHLVKIGLDGSVGYDNPNWIHDTGDVDIRQISQTNNGNYLILGTKAISQANRAFFSEYTPEGKLVFENLFFVYQNAMNHFTGLVKNFDGSYTLGGTSQRANIGGEVSIFICHYSADGELLLESVHEIAQTPATNTGWSGLLDQNIGRNLYKGNNGNWYYLVSALEDLPGYSAAKLYELSEAGATIVQVQALDMLDLNVCTGVNPNIGNCMIQRPDGSFMGLVNGVGSFYEIGSFDNAQGSANVNYSNPNFTYYFDSHPDGRIAKTHIIQRTGSNYFTAIERLSNGQIIMVGTTLSLGLDLELIAVFTS